MARRLRSPTKSSAVKKFTSSWDNDAYSPISPAGMSVQGARTGGKRRMSRYMIAAAMAPVTTKVPTVMPMIFPARARLRMLATALEMDAKTIGTTIQNMRLMKTVPRGLSTVAPAWTTAPSASRVTGKSSPAIQPRTMAPSMTARKA